MFWKAISPRVIWSSFVVGIMCAIIGAIIASWLIGPLFCVGAALTYFGTILNSRAVLACPFCHKRVKLGATACHHCGRQVA